MKGFQKFILTSFAFQVLIFLLMAAMWKTVTWTRPQLCQHSDATILVMGNSRIQYGFDDHQVPYTWNVGLNADNYNIIYWKLKTLHQYNPQIKKVLIEVDNATLFGYFHGVEYKLHPYYWDVMNTEDWLDLIIEDRTILLYPFDWMKILFPLKSLISPIAFQDLGIGSYTCLQRDKLQEDLDIENQTRKKRKESISNKSLVDDFQLKYLNKIVEYCHSHNICVEFINMPSYPIESIKHSNLRLSKFVKRTFPNIPFHNYELMELPDSCYGDISHLNYRGANTIAPILKKDIKF